MMIDKISNYNEDDIFVDTNILVRKIEGKKGYYELSKSKRFFASEFSILEFKRTVILKHYSLYTLLLDNGNDIKKTCDKIRKMMFNPVYEKDCQDWLDILERLGYPNKKDRSIIANLVNNMKFGLIHVFKENVYFEESVIKCDLINMKTKNHTKFISKIECGGCKNHFESIDKKILQDIYNNLILLGRKHGFDKICQPIDKILNDEKLEKHDCVLLGDVIISIDTPLELPIHTLNCKHLIPICTSIEKKVICE